MIKKNKLVKFEEEEVLEPIVKKKMKMISDIDLSNLVRNEFEETEKALKHLTKIAGISKRNHNLGKLNSK